MSESTQQPKNLANPIRVVLLIVLGTIGAIEWIMLRELGLGHSFFATAVQGGLLLFGFFAVYAIWRPTLCERQLHRFRTTAATLANIELLTSHTVLIASLVALVAYLTVEVRFFELHQNDRTNDTAAFLNFAETAHQRGGPVQLIRDLFSGKFDESNQHPLLIGILSVKPELSFGKTVGILLGIIWLVTIGWQVYLWKGPFISSCLVGLLAINFSFLHAQVLVTAECLTIGLLANCWILLARQSESSSPNLRQVGYAGALMGLAYLAKGTIPLLLVVTLLWLVLSNRTSAKRLSKQSFIQVTIFLTAFGIVSSPLLARNILRFGNPLYNANSWLLFADEFENPKLLAERETLKEAATRYLQTHSIGDIADREIHGLVWETYTFIRALGPTPLDDSRLPFGVAFLLLAALGFAMNQQSWRWLLLGWIGASLPLFAWYTPIAAGERFIAPYVPLVLLLASCAIPALLTTRFASKSVQVFTIASVVIAVVAAVFSWIVPMADRF